MISIFTSPEKKQALAYVKNLIELAAADNIFHQKEIQFIQKVGQQKGLKEREIEKMIDGYTPSEMSIPEDKVECFDMLYDLVQLMAVDGEIADSEHKICQDIALKMGFSDIIVSLLVSKIEQGIINNETREELIEKASPFIHY